MIPFLLQAVFISLSGVMAPGPLSAAIVGHGHRSPHAGALVALGHGIVEFPLMVVILVGFTAWLDTPVLRAAVGLAGGLVLLWMAVGLLRTARAPAAATAASGRGSALGAGILLTGANPYFLVWWLTVGAALLLRADTFGWPGLLAFAVAHWLCDLVWFWFLSAAVHGGGRVFGPRFQQLVLAACGLFLLVMGVDFVVDSVAGLRQGMG